ncbi:uncharacterized protein K444DRAFT_630880 [Hyaloscypha bicolor E]|uniref:F-box domain-containing protein n=1 Tax=Hyaloscypha bicolor E TaxID=1095630 RepID=A0A2J6T8C1_9HELO|nr:uncharacterized protein K444DRAFT_630880 [Hyaloscypha bicolor E]PMD59271.1 hypothetical protein K444DRAFT_630880 [Hyaloscypha bicolor E]
MTLQTPNLGILDRLPREVRDMVWEYICAPRGDQSNPHTKNNLASLGTCRQVYEELSAKVYDHETFIIRVSPRYQVNSWLCFENSRGAKWHVKGLEDARTRGFANLPYKRLKQVTISIEATQHIPGREDQGQIICLFFKMRDLTEILLEAKKGGLHNIELELLDLGTGKWYEGGWPKTTILLIQDAPSFVPEYDFSIVWLPLYSFASFLPSMKLGQLPCEMREFLMGEITAQEADQETRSDEKAKERSDILYAHFDLALDGEEGETADMLRLHRFSTWYQRGANHGSEYLRELERIWRDRAWEAAWRDGWNENDSIAIEKRCYMFHSLNPLYAKRQRGRSTQRIAGPFDKSPQFSEVLKDCLPAVNLEGVWDRDEWFRCYPAGIKPWKFITEGWRLPLYNEEGRIYRDASDAFADRFGGQASRCLLYLFGDEVE